MKSKIWDKLSPQNALDILRRLAEKDRNIAQRIEAEAKDFFKTIDLEKICEQVYSALGGIEVEELWDRSGPRRDGYSSPEEMAVEMTEEVLEPYNKKVGEYLELGMVRVAKFYCMGVLKGIYKYTHESKSEFKNWAEDVPEEYVGYLLEGWKKKTKNKNDIKEMRMFIEKECQNWAEWALRI
jgi:hypothetical protein